MYHFEIRKSTFWVLVLAAVALAALVFSAAVFVMTYRDLHRRDLLRPTLRSFHQTPPDYSARRQQEASTVQDWMTFHFMNKVFGLPPEFLRDNLKITDKNYPDISISSWARENKQDSQILTEHVRQLVKNFQSPSPIPSGL